MVECAEGSRILAVDDSPINLRLLQCILGNAGFDVVTTGNGPSVLNLALDRRPDLILLDVMMPDMDGFEVLDQLKSHSETRDLPVVMVTARTRGADVKQALEAGAFDYIKKPYDDIETVARVRSALKYKVQHDRLSDMATHDGLTGAYNHRLLIEILGKEIHSARRKGQPLAFCMADIDHFKDFNDRHGHQAGDYVLRVVTELLTQGLRRYDTVGRYGGEEFGLVLGGCDADVARGLCNRLRESVAQREFGWAGESLRVTLSMGLACASPDENVDEVEMVRRADIALYRAKDLGRNRMVG